MVRIAEKRRTSETAVTISGFTMGIFVTVITVLLIDLRLNLTRPNAAIVPITVAISEDVLRTVYDPEIPVNIYDLGLIYKVDVKDDGDVDLDMTFTAPSCPAAEFMLEDVRQKVEGLEGIKCCNVNIVFEPVWDQSMMSEEARVELGFD